ncbi:MAG: DUF3300 domain-containing protein [Pseudomonas sp.]|uniref:DUF3300 domain-containing protein n=1 Tax=Pseudomonas sp. TaxID=306 RepID=UPI003392C6D6
MRVYYRWTLLLAALALASCSNIDKSFAAPAPAAAPAAAATASEAVFNPEELDQMLAPLALYPDALLAQVLMATTYPGNVADAAAWSMEHPDSSGDTAVRAVAEQPWDPSVQSLVAFPTVLVMLGQDPAWVQRVGDAFLAQPDAVMDSVQRLRRAAKAAGHLKSNEQQQVTEKPAEPAPASASTVEVVQQPAPATIIIEPAQPQVIYVPSYNPTVVYGAWPYPSQPVYYPPPPGYYFGGALATGLGFAAGVAIIDSLWGDCNWGSNDIDIDVNRYNNINSNRKINANQNNWKHNAANRNGVPYRDQASREKFSQRLQGSQQRDAFRGRDAARVNDRERARQSLQQRGIEAPATSNREARARAQTATRDLNRQQSQARPRAQSNPQARQQVRQQQAGSRGARDNAFAGARSPGQTRDQANRGQASRQAASRPQSARSSGQRVQRAPSSSRSGGARRR